MIDRFVLGGATAMLVFSLGILLAYDLAWWGELGWLVAIITSTHLIRDTIRHTPRP